jgi:hypothetical protein
LHESGPYFDLFTAREKFPTLTMTTDPAPCCTGETVVLSGTFVASRDGTVSAVESVLCFTLPPNPSPTACNNNPGFTLTTLATPVNVVSGQQVLVTVRISFS